MKQGKNENHFEKHEKPEKYEKKDRNERQTEKPDKLAVKKKNNKVKIIPLGGLEQIGMNMTVIEYEDTMIVIDCGLTFPGEDMLGIDLVIPDVTYLKNNIDKLKGFVITHGHEEIGRAHV